ncbi:MAG TPA: hypothetical protein VGB09_00320 [Candidatus Binatia bacterium]
MPPKRSLRGASAKQERQYEHIKKKAQRSGRYGQRAKEVAARTVMKQRSKKTVRRKSKNQEERIYAQCNAVDPARSQKGRRIV